MVCFSLSGWSILRLTRDFHRALTIASSHPDVRIVAIDQVPQMPEELPNNVEFHQLDVNNGLSAFYGEFDMVHVRCIGSGTASYRALIKEATKCLKPNGLAVFIEGDFDLVEEDQRTIKEPARDAYPDGSWLQRWMQGKLHHFLHFMY